MIQRYIKGIFSLTWFLLTSKSQILYVELPVEVFRKKLDVDAESLISSYINIAQYTDLSQYDNLMAEDDTFWSIEEPSHINKSLRYLLKLGWLTNSIRNEGLANPIQLLQSKNNKYIAHPGTARAIVVSYLYPVKTIRCFYVWDKDIDPTPSFLYYPHRIIKSPLSFYKLFDKRSKYFEIFTTTLTEKSTSNDYLNFAVDALKIVEPHFNLAFLTVKEKYHWSEIRNQVFFKDIISFPDNNTCILGGVKFNKINNKWIII